MYKKMRFRVNELTQASPASPWLQVCSESMRFEKLMEHFKTEDDNIDFLVDQLASNIRNKEDKSIKLKRVCCQVACMQFINIVVHSVEDMNFRVHLQYDFTKLNLEEHLEVNTSPLLVTSFPAK